MKIKLLGAFVAIAILLTAGVVATRVASTEASSAADIGQGDAFAGNGDYYNDVGENDDDRRHGNGDNSDKDGDASGKPYIGIAIAPAPDDGDGALIARVVEGSAADGILQVDDIITALDGEAVSGPRDVVRIVREHSPGDVIVFGIVRNGASMDVSVTVGEAAASERKGRGGKHGYGFFDKASERLVLSDTRYMTDDGVKTVRRAIGAAQNIDTSAGSFDLLLRDGSETLSFTIDDDTKIATDAVSGEASLSDIDTDATTMVVEVTQPDGARQVQLVAQGEFSLMAHSLLGHRGFDRMSYIEREGREGFSPRKFFFQWRGDHDDKGYD